MLCHIYRSKHRADAYLYLADKDDFASVPEALLKLFGKLEFSFSFALCAERKLAREDTDVVIKNLETQGYHLQLTEDVSVEQMLAVKAIN